MTRRAADIASLRRRRRVRRRTVRRAYGRYARRMAREYGNIRSGRAPHQDDTGNGS